MLRVLIALVGVALLTGCSDLMGATIAPPPENMKSKLQGKMDAVPELNGQRMTIAVYGFQDKTGQKKASATIAQLSSAVTQGAEVWVIDALKNVGRGTWFRVLERVGIDNVIKERQMIRQARESYEGPAAKSLPPMLFAGLILEGGIIGYDSTVSSGGAGARLLGIGASVQYTTDVVVVSMRMVSVQTGEVLLNTAVTKTILSVSTHATMFKFFDSDAGPGTLNVDAEIGFAANEPVNYAVRSAIDQAVIQLIQDGVANQLWSYKNKEEGN
jgi:curli production assembly/transport component CsgG